jgi:hypothetical protein
MALVNITAVNQTGTAVPLTQLMVPNGVIPASSSVALTDYNWVEEVLRDTELQGFIQTNSIVLSLNAVQLTKEQSLAFLDAPTRPVKNSVGMSQGPTPDDDRNAGYSVGSRWITTGGIGYCCSNDAAGAAVWERQIRASDSITELSDVNTVGATQGSILYYNDVGQWVHLPPGTDGQLLVTQGAGANPIWETSNNAVRRFFSYSFTSSSGQPYIESTAVAYETIGYFEWPGTNIVDALSQLRVIVSLGGGTSMSVRVYDSTNIQTIAELTGITDTTFTTRDLGTLSNLSATDAVWEIQILAVGGGRKARLATLTGIF